MHRLCIWSQLITNNEASNFVESSFHCSSETAQCLTPWHSPQPITISVQLLQITWHFWESCNSLRIFQSQIPIWKVHYAYTYTHSASHNHSNWLQNPALHPSLNTWLWCGRILPQIQQKELSFEARLILKEQGIHCIDNKATYSFWGQDAFCASSLSSNAILHISGDPGYPDGWHHMTGRYLS